MTELATCPCLGTDEAARNTGWLLLDGWGGKTAQRIEIVGETRTRTMIRAIVRTRLDGRRGWLEAGKSALVPRSAVRTQVPNGYEEVEL